MSESPIASIAVIVVEVDRHDFGSMMGLGFGKDILVYVASNPQIRATGDTEAQALERLRAHILSHAIGKKKVVNMHFDELIVEEVMGS